MNLVFLDPKCPTPYDSEALRTRGLGGTEGTVIRVANGLSSRHNVCVLQHNRTEALIESETLQFLPMSSLEEVVARADHVVFVQKAQHIDTVVKKSTARVWLWLHNFLQDEVPFYWKDHLRYKLGIICVSQTHLDHTQRYLKSLPIYWASLGLIARGGMLFHHNPLDENLDNRPIAKRDPNKLVFFSSPYKGIEHVLEAFRVLHTRNKNLKLYVADPGYIKNFDSSTLNAPGIVRLGTLPQHEVLRHVREALCVFYPQYKRPETFGLVFAEANALGTPVLANDFGAAREILCANNPPVDAHNIEAVADTVIDWVKNGAPITHAQPQFKLSYVIKQWDDFLSMPEKYLSEKKTPIHIGEVAALPSTASLS